MFPVGGAAFVAIRAMSELHKKRVKEFEEKYSELPLMAEPEVKPKTKDSFFKRLVSIFKVKKDEE